MYRHHRHIHVFFFIFVVLAAVSFGQDNSGIANAVFANVKQQNFAARMLWEQALRPSSPGDFRWAVYCPSLRSYCSKTDCPDYAYLYIKRKPKTKPKGRGPSDFHFTRWCPGQRGYFPVCDADLPRIPWLYGRPPANGYRPAGGTNTFQHALQAAHGGSGGGGGGHSGGGGGHGGGRG